MENSINQKMSVCPPSFVLSNKIGRKAVNGEKPTEGKRSTRTRPMVMGKRKKRGRKRRVMKGKNFLRAECYSSVVDEFGQI